MPFFILTIFTVPLIVSWILFITLFVLFKKKGLRLNEKQSWRFKGLIISVALVFGFFFFFKDQDFIFDCRHDTQKCEYYHSTMANKKLRLAGTYDISDVTNIEIKEHYRRRKSGYKDYFYKIAFVSSNDEFEMPYDFSFRDNARDEAAKISAFLTKNQDVYHYERIRSEEGNFLLYFMLGFFAEIIAVAGSVLFGFRLYQESKVK
ncbi:MAG: hypothetical protein IJ752_00110 [Alphaproteobacteria bacterium]|nr:hypothetical protein [Alphaproteobacteria bacterium]